MKNNPALGSIIAGAIINVLNVVFFIILLASGWIFNSVWLVVGAIAGIVSAVKGLKAGQGIFAIVGLVLNIMATLGSIVLAFIYIIS